MRVALGTFSGLSLVVAVALLGAEPQKPPTPYSTSFECQWTDTAITIDGEASEEAWKHAQPIDRFHKAWLGQGDRDARAATRAKLLWDRDYLYFFAEMDDTDLLAQVNEHDGPTWNDDVFELFFQPAADKPGYYEFQVNALGTVFDCFFPKRDLASLVKQKRDGRFHLEQKVKLRGTLNQSRDQDQGWSVEGRIPWADFARTGGRPAPGEKWNIALCRYDYLSTAKEPELSSIANFAQKRIPAFFHQHEDYAQLTFVGPTAKTAKPYGIPSAPPVTTSTVVGSPDPPLPYQLKRLLPHYSPKNPIMAKAIPGTQSLMVIVQDRPYSATRMNLVKDDPEAKPAAEKLLFNTPENGTAYDFCFHPKFAENGYVYVGWNGGYPGKPGRYSKVSRYQFDFATESIDPKTERLIIEWPSDGHNGAAVCFGNDGYLYITSGDGTSDSDVNLMGQRTDHLLSKLLRIDVDHPEPGRAYAIPKDNPFVHDQRFAPETFAYGLRNPWRLTCDPVSGQIWIGNNGQDLWETAYLARPGDNYGWSVVEGSHPFYRNRQVGPTPIVKPTIEHHHSEFRSLTGGVVHRGTLAELHGAYIYGDYSTGRIWGMKHNGQAVEWHRELATSRLQISGFGHDTRGNLIICDHRGDGALYTLAPTPKNLPPSTFPRKLSESGLFERVPGHVVKPGVIPYFVNAPFWSDGLHKQRYIALPPGEKIGFTRWRGWNFPDKTVIIKSFAIEQVEGDPTTRKWIETRFLTKQGEEWFGYTYLWNDEGTDAELLGSAGLDKTFTVKVPVSAAHPDGLRQQLWHYPSRAECMVCHSRAQNFVLGLCEVQTNKLVHYGHCTDQQLRVFEHLGILSYDYSAELREQLKKLARSDGVPDQDLDQYVRQHSPQPGQRGPNGGGLLHQSPEKFRALVDPQDETQDLTKRAKSWLHTNCSSCHVEAGGGNAMMELEYLTELNKMRIVDVRPVHATLDLPDARLIAPGHPERSVLLKRISQRGPHQMPPLSSNRVDEFGVKLLTQWITSLKPTAANP